MVILKNIICKLINIIKRTTNDIDKKQNDIKEEKTFVEFTDEDKEKIVALIKPLVKDLNSNDLYSKLCEIIAVSKQLKTFVSLSDDKMVLTIKLTNNKVFNELISDFINDHVIDVFKNAINIEFLDKFELDANNGEILIKKVR